MGKKSAGIILFRRKNNSLEIMLVHPGGPFWAKKDAGAWSIPKGEFDEGEDALQAATREFEEETGKQVTAENFIELSPVKNKGSKIVYAFAAEQDFDTTNIAGNLIWVDWPPHSGKRIEVPEVDKAAWFDIETAKEKIHAYQLPLIEELMKNITHLY
ncbi:NUDIX domain-containing protein [Parafilimonas sp.]|uniref:NUDIX domain-containing protein n=1 Tax=Parafilimonas sp. TaxID=1969739 RepID=UPI0039E6D025